MLLHFDGFDNYYTDTNTSVLSYLQGEYTTEGSTAAHGRITTMPEIGTLCLLVSTPSTTGRVRWIFPDGDSTSRTFGVGFHFYTTNNSTLRRLISFNSASGTRRFALGFANDTFELFSGTGSGSSIGSASGFGINTLYHIEIKVVQHASTGSIEVRVNGATVINATGLNTAATLGQLGFGISTTGASGESLYYDNLYVWDNTGAENNDWLGERLVYTLMPDGDGATQDWTLSTGSDTYALLDNIPSDPNNQYIESSAVDDIAQVTMSDLPSMDIIPIGVKVLFRGMKTGTSSIEVGVAPSGKTPVGHPLTQDQSLYFGNIYETNPDTGQPWTPSEINALTLDIKRVL